MAQAFPIHCDMEYLRYCYVLYTYFQREHVTSSRIGKFLNFLEKKGPDAINIFIMALVSTSQGDHAKLIDEELTKKVRAGETLKSLPEGPAPHGAHNRK